MNVMIGTIPIIIHEAIICHNANLSDEDDSMVRIERPESTPVPKNPIRSRTVSYTHLTLPTKA